MFKKNRGASDLYAQPMDRAMYEDENIVHRSHDRLSEDVDDNEKELIDDTFYDASNSEHTNDEHENTYASEMQRNYERDFKSGVEIETAVVKNDEIKSNNIPQKRNFIVFLIFGALSLGLFVYIVYLIVTVFTTIS